MRLTNRLAEPTTIHWHGLRLPAPLDGTGMVQRPVAPGETFVYRFRLPDAGTFWYHSHSNETVQMERGLHGALVVRGAGEPRLDAERVLVLDDVALDRAGEIRPPGWWVEHHDGRQGDTRQALAVPRPAKTTASVRIAPQWLRRTPWRRIACGAAQARQAAGSSSFTAGISVRSSTWSSGSPRSSPSIGAPDR